MGHALEVQVPSDTPAGSAPAVTAQVYGVVPPLTETVGVYAVFTVAFGSDVVPITGGEKTVSEHPVLVRLTGVGVVES
jgi:hypothetical protein